MNQDKTDLGEQVLSKLAEVGVASQLDQVEELDVNVKTNPIKAIQGQVDSVSLEGKGMVMQKDLRIEKMQLQTNSISIDPLKAAFGQIKLTHSTEATTEVVLTEADINRALSSDYILQKLQGLSVLIDEKPISIDMQTVEFRLPGDGKIFLSASIPGLPMGNSQKISFTAVPGISSDHQQVLLDSLEYSEGEDLSPQLTNALLEQVHELLNFRNFEFEEMSLYLTELKVEKGKMTFIGKADIKNFPGGE